MTRTAQPDIPFLSSAPKSLLNQRQAKLNEKWTSQSMVRGEHPCRKIVFTIRSHDQGWGGNYANRGTFQGSSTWFDVGLERFELRNDESTTTPTDNEAQASESAQQSVVVAAQGTRIPGEHNLRDDSEYFLRTIDPPTKLHGPSESREIQHPVFTSKQPLQMNKSATSATAEYIITWAADDDINPESEEGKALEEAGRGRATGNGEFVRNLRLGDIITVWARARYPGWTNTVEHVKIDVYWAT